MSGAQRVDLPSGGWVALKDPRHVTVRGRRPVMDLMGRFEQLGVAGVDEMLCVGGAALIAQWSFDQPISEATIGDLIDVDDADVLLRAVLPLIAELAPNLTVDDASDPESPTPA